MSGLTGDARRARDGRTEEPSELLKTAAGVTRVRIVTVCPCDGSGQVGLGSRAKEAFPSFPIARASENTTLPFDRDR
jgi:hypothetical protein